MNYKHLFGPVQSRRLGYSLGVDLVPYKYCPLNCVYCEVQHTTHLTLQREEFFPLEEIASELEDFLAGKPELGYITFSGAGEPTLYSHIGDMISHLKREHPRYKLALLTNGILLKDAGVRKEILPCDLILPSLDACHQDSFEKINRPMESLKVEDLINGLISLRREYQGMIWLEVFVIEGINDSAGELDCLCEAIRNIKPDRVQINSLDRPGAEEWVEAARTDVLLRVRDHFEKRLNMPVQIIAKTRARSLELHVPEEIERAISDLLIKQPSTAEDLSVNMDLHINEVSKFLRQLHNQQKVNVERKEGEVVYSWIQ
jgi:wyosine [tRNA(Phe)-imidazoG37] synthetase (radical SAM superfamily)